MRIKDLEQFIFNVNSGLDKIHFKLGHQYNYYTIELYLRDYTEETEIYRYRCIIYTGNKKDCYDFINSFSNILKYAKLEI